MSNPSDPFQNASDLAKLLREGVAQAQAESLAQVSRTFHQAYVKAGFTDDQAFTFTLSMMEAGSRP